jgi:hypothetical protein
MFALMLFYFLIGCLLANGRTDDWKAVYGVQRMYLLSMLALLLLYYIPLFGEGTIQVGQRQLK